MTGLVRTPAQLRPIGSAAGCPLSIDLFTAGGRERLQLQIRRLVEGGYPSVTDAHGLFSKVSRKVPF